MTKRFVNYGLRILVAVALMLAVISSPILPTRLSHSARTPNYLPRNFAILEIWQIGQPVMSALPTSLREGVSFDSDTEEELEADLEDETTSTSPPASVSFELLPSPCPEPHPEVVGFAVARAARPLRC